MLTALMIVAAPLENLRAEENAPEKAPADKAHTVVKKGSKVSLEYTPDGRGRQSRRDQRR
jgi:hypothetical protein